MKTLHDSIIFATLALFFFTFYLGNSVEAHATCFTINGTEECDIPGPVITLIKSQYVPNETINLVGVFRPNTMIQIDLIDPDNNIENSISLQSDSSGNFKDKLTIPNNEFKGNWKIKASSEAFHVHSIYYITMISSFTDPASNLGCCGTLLKLIIDSPLKQFKSGIAAKDVTCKEDLQLVIKASDGHPVCLKPDNAYLLITHGWAKKFIQSASQSSACIGTQVPSGDHRMNAFPVLIMPQNSTALVCVTYNFEYDWDSYPNKSVYPYGILETCCFVHMEKYSTQVFSNQFKVLAHPLLFNVTGVHKGSKVAVIYKISGGSSSKGFYDTSIPFDNCLSYPLAVGYSTSEVDATKFHANFDIPCFTTIENVDSVKIVSGMAYKELQFP